MGWSTIIQITVACNKDHDNHQILRHYLIITIAVERTASAVNTPCLPHISGHTLSHGQVTCTLNPCICNPFLMEK